MPEPVDHEIIYMYRRGEGTQAVCLCGWVSKIFHSARAARENAGHHPLLPEDESDGATPTS